MTEERKEKSEERGKRKEKKKLGTERWEKRNQVGEIIKFDVHQLTHLGNIILITQN